MRYDQFGNDEEIHPFRIGCALIGAVIIVVPTAWLVSAGLGIVSLPFKAVSSATSVTSTIISPANALMQYRWFHDADARLQTFPAQIDLAHENLAYAEQHAPDRVSARETEYTGIRQVCMTLVADYNSHASRLDAGFFRNPERWLPVSTESWTPLPPSYTPDHCNPKEPSQ